jgi:hypothetical protein
MQSAEDPRSKRGEKIGTGGRIRWKHEQRKSLLGVRVAVWRWVVLHGMDE